VILYVRLLSPELCSAVFTDSGMETTSSPSHDNDRFLRKCYKLVMETIGVEMNLEGEVKRNCHFITKSEGCIEGKFTEEAMELLKSETGEDLSCFVGTVQAIQVAMAKVLLPDDVQVSCRVALLMRTPERDALSQLQLWVLPLASEQSTTPGWYSQIEELKISESVMIGSELRLGALEFYEKGAKEAGSSRLVELSVPGERPDTQATKATWAHFLHRVKKLWRDRGHRRKEDKVVKQHRPAHQMLDLKDWENARIAFEKIDVNGDGSLSMREMTTALEHLRPELGHTRESIEEACKLFAQADDDHNNRISFEEFLEVVNLWHISSASFDDFY